MRSVSVRLVSECVGLLDGVAFLPSRELSVNEETRGKGGRNRALEGVRVEFVSEGGSRHRYSRGVLTARSSEKWAITPSCRR